ncbi:MAG: hypothetical protein GX974_01130, partial [Clostridiales bacterium]|nr:hypothetical protein [Clostridiales bacterium]
FLISQVFLLRALQEGPTSLTNIVNSFQAIMPIIVGLLIWNEGISSFQMLGLILFFIVLLLFNKGSYDDGKGSKKVTLKWALFAGISAIGSGIAIIFTKQYMLTFDGFIKEYLIIYNCIILIISIPYLAIRGISGKQKFALDKGFLLYTASPALITDITNTIYMLYIARFQSAFFFPFMSVLNILSVVIMSRVLLKEKISRPAYIGIVLSFVAIYLLGIE